MAYTFEIPDSPVFVELDSDGYARVLNNLISNVLAHSRASRVALGVTVEGQNARVTVADNGIGIAKEELAPIFERLYKADRGRFEKGSGLGLSIARQITEKMNGTITADSQPGVRTVFTMQFPVKPV